jgi:lysylphosphatidylglycerol synthase-like protein
MPDSRPRRPLTLAGVLTTAGGVLLFVWWIQRVGLGEIRSGFRQIGWGLLLIVMLGGLRFALRAAAWILSIEPPHRLRFRDAFGAVVAGDALGNLLPLGPLVSEPAKAAFVRPYIALGPAATALAIENVLYTLSVAATIAAGMAALLFVFDIPVELREVSEVAIAGVVLLFVAALAIVWMQPAVLSRTFAMFAQGPRSARRLDRLRALEQQIYTFASRRGAAMIPIAGAELSFHALGVLEAYITLWLLFGAPPSLVIAFIVETVNRLITVVFKFIPLQVGVNEAGSALLTGVVLCWTAVGVILLVRHGLSARRILTDPQLSSTRAR